MFFKLFLLGLIAVARAAPQVVEVVAEVAEPVAVAEATAVAAEAVAPAVVEAAPVVTPVEYAINTCRTEAEPFETQTCTPHHERVCISADVVNQKISYEKKCKDVVSVVCPQSPVPLGGTVLVKREADPLLYTSYGLGPAHLPIHHYATVRQACQEVTTQHCVDSPIVVDEPGVAESCHIVTKVHCIPQVEHIPKTICDPVETVVPGKVINPLAYQGLYFGF